MVKPYIPGPLGDTKEKSPAGSGLESRGPNKVCFQTYPALIEVKSEAVPGCLALCGGATSFIVQ